MSFGYSVGDFVVVVQLAYKVSPPSSLSSERRGVTAID
jgi:hypothetical protein